MQEPLSALVDRLVAGDAQIDPAAVYRRLRAEAPVCWHEGMQVWILTRYEDVRRVLREPGSFAPLTEGPGTPIFGRTILQMTGREHSRKTAIVARRMRNPGLLAGELRENVERRSQRLLDELGAPEEVVDLKAGYTSPLPLAVITDLLDVPQGMHWVGWYDALAAGGVGSITGDLSLRERALAARDEVFAYIGPIIEERRRAPGRDLLSDVASIEYEGVRLTQEEAQSFVAFLLTAGVETTDRVLSSLLGYLAAAPALWQRLRTEPTLVPAACAEALRLFPPVQALTRRVTGDITLRGVDLKAGQRVLIVLASANRDQAVFEDPDTFQLDRFREAPEREFTGASSILSFGGGEHHCTGAQLARVEMQVALEHLLQRYSRLEPDHAMPAPQGFILRSPPALPVRLVAAP
jgi:cytochrome P450